MIDLDNEEHREALRMMCDAVAGQDKMCAPVLARALENNSKSDWENILALALRTISDHAQAAELIRALVERAAVSVRLHSALTHLNDYCAGDPFIRIAVGSTVVWRCDADGDTYFMDSRDTIRAIARLLALAPGAGADAVLAALRGGK